MKKFTKIISVVLIISAMLMTTFMPAFAAFPEDSEATIWVEKEQQEDPDIYKITFCVEANYPVSVIDARVYWPTAEFKLIRKTGERDSSVTTRNALNYLNGLLDEEEYDTTDYEEGYVLGPGAFDKTVIINVDAKYFSDAVPQDTYSALQMLAIVGNENHYYYDTSRWGNEVLEFYIQKLDGAPDDAINHVDVRPDAKAYEICWTSKDKADTEVATEMWHSAGNVKDFAKINYGKTAEATGPKVERSKAEIKMTPTGDGRTVEDDFQFRVVSKISDADWKAYLSNTGSSEDKNCLTQLGFVAYKGTENFDMALAQAAAKAGETQGEYEVATTNYVKYTDGSDAEFAARIDTTKTTCADATYIAFIQYKDADGTEQYAFYDAEYTALIKTNYDLLVSQYLGQFPFVG